jgi:prepilin-type processing-associated H-X9-DG protein
VIVGERPSMPNDYWGWLGYKDYDSMIWAFVVNPSYDAPAYTTSNGVRFPAGSPCPWPMGFGPGNIRENCDTNHIWSQHTNGANFAMGDGSVRFIAYSAGAALIGQMATRAGGEILPNF